MLGKHGVLALPLGLCLAACGSPTGPSSPAGVESLVASLRGAGASVEARGSVFQPFFSVSPALFEINGGGARLQVFEYASAEQAQGEAALVRHDGRAIDARPGGPAIPHVCWIGTPHFYLWGRLIVLYVGDDPGVLALLADRLGPPFAGGEPNPPGALCR